ncbi:MAG: hypothetical protein RMJ56_05445 [Gemmataceae bacterium]|nr:hypothetical protein [Gemmata sp.]MDW8197033.1 hypothetical protein [Gemmataceae bacterium]
MPPGGRYVRFEVCWSLLVLTIRGQTRVYRTESWRQRLLTGSGFSLMSLLLGPWGIPWGLIGTVWAIWVNLTGGIDCTAEVLATTSSTADSASTFSGQPPAANTASF